MYASGRTRVGDQAFNASRVEELHAGIQLPTDASPQRIATALHTLLDDRRFRTGAARAANRIAVEDPDRAAAEALERIARRA